MEDTLKKCGYCKCKKQLSEFNKCKRGTFGVHGYCRKCQKEFRHKWYLTHKQQEITNHNLPENKEKRKLYRLTKYHTDSNWRLNFLTKNNLRRRQEPAKIKAREQRKKWLLNPHNRIAQSLRGRIRIALKLNIKTDTTEKLLGCSFEYARQYLEKLFTPGMTWNNYGEWHIDHIIPCKFFDLSNPDHQKLCFNYKNLQPLWKFNNISKGNKVNIDNINEILNQLKSNINTI